MNLSGTLLDTLPSTANSSCRVVIEDVLIEVRRTLFDWAVDVTWEDGSSGPQIFFASDIEASNWVRRDAAGWLRLLRGRC